MSLKLTSDVWENSPHEGNKLLLQLALADYANDDGTCYGSYPSLAKKSRCHPDTVRVHVKALIEEGWMKLVSQGTGPGKASQYQITLRNSRTVDAKPYGSVVGNPTDLAANPTDGSGVNGYNNSERTVRRPTPQNPVLLTNAINPCGVVGCIGGWIEGTNGALTKCFTCYPQSVPSF